MLRYTGFEELQLALAERDATIRRLEQRLAELERPTPALNARARRLTETERRIAELVVSGRTNWDVARALHLSEKTVEWNLTKIYRKLYARSRTELAAKLTARVAAA
jgi:DNA-binding NarL/FixJ family response regulator